jgi:hypothetical protein
MLTELRDDNQQLTRELRSTHELPHVSSHHARFEEADTKNSAPPLA